MNTGNDIAPRPGDALLVTDVQNDFVTGTLAVPGAAAIVAPLNHAMAAFDARGLPVVTIRDWHPLGHCSFAKSGGPWPEHCVQGSHGAEFVAGLCVPPGALLVSKGSDPRVEAYSGFKGTALEDELRARNVRRLFIGGLATDYCILNTVHDAIDAGFAAVVLTDGIRAVDVHRGDGARAVDEMRRAGARFALIEEVLRAPVAKPR